jgi:IS1 family transposase
MLERSSILSLMNRLDTKTRARIVACLVEGNSVRATCRLTGAAKGTVLKLLVEIGQACSEYQHRTLRGLSCKRIQCDEIWSFCYAKDKNVPSSKADPGAVGSIWTWTAIDADSKLMVSYHIGTRDAGCAHHFMRDVAARLAHRVQLTTDGYKPYLEATYSAFEGEVDYAMLVKLYGPEPAGPGRYSPPQCIGARIDLIDGEPDLDHVSTSYVERANLTMRMGMRRFTRLTNGFSKKVENLEHAVSLHTMHYNFCRPHQTLTKNSGRKMTPAMAAGVANHVWTLDEVVALMPETVAAPWGSKSGRRPAGTVAIST